MADLFSITRRIAEQAIKGIHPEDLENLDHPLDAVERLLLELPEAAIKIARKEIAAERRRPIPIEIKRAVSERDGKRCVVCGETESLHYHHYIHVANGGQNTTGNLVLLCANHHMAVHAGQIQIKKPRAVPTSEKTSQAVKSKTVKSVPAPKRKSQTKISRRNEKK